MPDNVKNFVKATVSTGYNAAATSVVLQAGHGAKMPTPPFNLIWWNSTDFPDQADDPDVEIVRVTAVSADTLTITRAQESTTATDKNTAGKTYKMAQGPTAQTILDLTLGVNFRVKADGTAQWKNPSTGLFHDFEMKGADGSAFLDWNPVGEA